MEMDIHSINNQGKAGHADILKKPEQESKKRELKRNPMPQKLDDKVTLSAVGVELSEKTKSMIIAHPNAANIAIGSIDDKKAEELLK